MTKKELMDALVSYNDEDQIYMVTNTFEGLDEDGVEVNTEPGLCVFHNNELIWVGAVETIELVDDPSLLTDKSIN